LDSIARSQFGIVSLEQATSTGLTEEQLAWAVRTGRLERAGRGVLSVPGAPRTWEQQLMAGRLHVGPDAVVSRRAAGTMLAFDGFRASVPEFTVLRGRQRRHADLLVHTTSLLPPIDVVTIGQFRVTSGARTIIDLARDVHLRELEAAVDSALRDGWTSETYLRRRLAALRGSGRSGVRRLDQVLDGRPTGAASFLEREFLRLVRDAGLPTPQCQVVHAREGLFVARVDAQFPGTNVIVEVAGHRTHSTRRQRQHDAQRIAELTVSGSRVLTFTYEDVVERPRYVADILRAALTAPSRDAFGCPPPKSVA
jgi:hypothetical protein